MLKVQIMRQVLLAVAITLSVCVAQAQINSYSTISYNNAGNPGGLNTEADFDVTGWGLIFPGSQFVNSWSTVVNLPFYFEFYGQPVTSYKVSGNGLLTFATASALLPNENVDLPTSQLPDNSIACYWDRFTVFPPTSANDQVLTKTFGTFPNRQYWIRWTSFEWNSISFANVAVVLEESTHKIYLVDMYSSFPSTGISSTSGVQKNSTTAVQSGSSSTALAGNGSAYTDNSYKEFLPILIQPYDIAPIAITSPASSDCGLSLETVSIQVTNTGFNPASGVSARFSVDGGAYSGAETIPGSIPVGGVVNFSFANKANLTAIGLHTIKVALTVGGDGNHLNDTLSKEVVHVGSVNVLPYVEDFEQGAGGWVAQGTNSSWQLGTPAGAVIQGAASGTQAWVTNLTGPYLASEKSQVYSPCFNFTNATSSMAVNMRVWWETEGSWDGAALQYSTDGGTTWTNVGGYLSADSWYNNLNIVGRPGEQGIGWSGRMVSNLAPGNWVTVTHPLPAAVLGQPEVRFRVAFASDGFNNYDGIAFDRFLVGDAPVVNLGSNGLKCTGTVLSAGNTGASYIWSTGATSQTITLTNNTGQWINDSMISVLVTNGIGITTRDTLTYSMAPPLSVTVDSVRNVVCGGTATGAIFVSPVGGAGPYNFTWTNGTTAQNLLNAPAGTYSASVTDAAGCTSSVSSRTITQNVPVAVALDSTRNVNCFGSLSGRIYITPSGGTGPYTYQWSNGLTSQDILNVPAGAYTVTVKDNLQCPKQISANITQNDSIAIKLDQITKVSCSSAQDGGIAISVSGGVGPYSYLWSNGASVQDPAGLSAGSHTVYVTDAKACVKQKVFQVGQEVVMQLGLVSMLPAACEEAATGELSISVAGGTAPFSYSWDNGQTTANPINLSVGYHSVNIQDYRGCTAVDSFLVAISSDTIAADLVQMNPAACQAILDGSLTISVNGGQAPYTYAWSNGASNQNPSGLTSGTYEVVIRDALGCTNSFGFEVDALDSLVIVLDSVSDASCLTAGDGALFISVTGGATPYTFLWEGGNVSEDPAGLFPGENKVLVRDAAGCEGIAAFTVGNPAPPEVVINDIQGVTCADDPLGTVSLTITGGSQPYSFVWNNGATSEDLTGVKGGWYQLAITQTGGCETFSDSIYVPFTDSIPVASFVFSREGLVTTVINTSAYGQTYTWNFGDGVGTATGDSIVYVYQNPGEYTITLTATGPCGTDVFTDTIGVYPTGIAPELALGVTLFPNPTAGQFYLDVNDGQSGQVSVIVYDQWGRRIMDQTWKNRPAGYLQMVLPTGTAKGVYLVEVQSGDKKAFRRIILQ